MPLEPTSPVQQQQFEAPSGATLDWIPLDAELCEQLCGERPPRAYSYWTQFVKDIRSYEILQYLLPALIVGALITYQQSWRFGLAVAGFVTARYLFTVNRAVSAMRHDTVEYGTIAGYGDPAPYQESRIAKVAGVRGMTAELSNGVSALVVLKKGPLTELLDSGRSVEVLVRYGPRHHLHSVIAYRPLQTNPENTSA